jgi:hypothetical protein
MAKAPKPDLDETTLQIARRMLNTPPKHHDEMKVGAGKRASKRKLKASAEKRRNPRR